MKRIVASEVSDYETYEGWDSDLEVIQAILDACMQIGKLEYELDKCVRGAYSGCDTYSELAEHVIKLGKELQECGEYLEDESEYLD